MAWRFVRQPDGMLARFSEVVDDFTHHGMPHKAAFNLAFEKMGIMEAEEKIENAYQNPDRWSEALQIIDMVHGRDHLNEVLEEMGFEPLETEP